MELQPGRWVTDQPRLFGAPAKRGRGRVTLGLDTTLRALGDTGRLEAVDAALVSLAREAAALLQGAVLDTDESRYTCGVLIARYHAVLTHLLARPDDDGGADLAALLAGMGDDTGPRVPD